MVEMPLANEWIDSWYPAFHCSAISTSWPSSACSNEATLRNSDSLEAFRCLTKSTMPPLYLYVVLATGSVRSSTKRISRPLFKKAMICIRSRIVCARNSVSSKTEPSGQKVTVVPVLGSPVVRSFGAGPVALIFCLTLPPFSNSASQCWPSRSTSSTSRVERALTTEIPTPWRPPETW